MSRGSPNGSSANYYNNLSCNKHGQETKLHAARGPCEATTGC